MRGKLVDPSQLSDLSHDFMNPLNGVIGNAKLLLGTPLDTSQREHVEMILSSAQTLLAEVKSLLQEPNSYALPAAEEEFSSEHFKGLRILLAEDNSINQKVAAKTLEKQGFIVTLANNGKEALELIKASRFDVVLMDCQMPEMDGYETTRRIRALPSVSVKNIPIIAMTANALRGDREACLNAGMSDYIAKPFRLPELLSALNHSLKSGKTGGS